MAVSLTTAGGINLNSKTTYFLANLDLGVTEREESWLQPAVLGAAPTLMGYWDRATKMTIGVRVKAASIAALRTAIENVRNEFVVQSVNTSQGGDNYLTWNDGTASRVIPTYASNIAPLPIQSSDTSMFMVLGQFTAIDWTFQLWRSPYYASEAATKRTPVM
jgi:hypothetical protein